MRRREFIAGLGVAAASPMVTRAQQGERVRRLGVLSMYDGSTPNDQRFLASLARGLAELGWIEARNLRTDVRWAAGSVDLANRYAKEVVSLQPDIIFAESTPSVAALERETQTIPIVFQGVSDPIGSGFIAGLARPGGNITGLAWMEPTMGGKWLELLRDIVPNVKSVAAVFNPDTAPYVRSYYLPSFENAARSFNVEWSITPVRSDAEIEAVIATLADKQNSGLVALSDSFMGVHAAPTAVLAARYKVPVVYFNAIFPRAGGLLSYAADTNDQWHRAAAYIDRIFRGAKPADLPVQLPVKFEMVVNVKAAKALGLNVPQSILLLADEVIE
jgi:putative tryptophan/tyrosine transport system substrate-binding protein